MLNRRFHRIRLGVCSYYSDQQMQGFEVCAPQMSLTGVTLTGNLEF